MDGDEKHPIIFGLVALVAVAVSVGAVLGIVVLVGTRVVGLGNDANSAASDTGASLYLPSPSPTQTPSGPMLTLTASPSATASPTGLPTKIRKPAKKITLQASTVNASPMQLFELSGLYPNAEGALLRLQRQMPGGGWQDFGIPDVAVSGGQFSTQVQTGRTGIQKFRMKDVDADRVSNVVQVTIG